MATGVSTGGVHHMTLTVADTQRSTAFYTRYLGFQHAVDFEQRKILSNGTLLLVLAPPPDPAQAITDDRFNENRIGLDHVSLSVTSRDDLEAAARLFDEAGVSHGEVKDLGPGFGIYVMAIRDPDNIQVELAAPYAA
jgi:glyoxylase I family protein